MRQFVAGDEAAFGLLYARWSPLVYTYSLRALGLVADAESVTESVFASVWAARATVDPDVSLAVWLIEIARDRVVTVLADRAEVYDARDVTTPKSADGVDLEDRLLVADVLADLEPDPQRVMRLVLNEGLSHQQVAARLRLPRHVVKAHIRDSLQGIRLRLEARDAAR